MSKSRSNGQKALGAGVAGGFFHGLAQMISIRGAPARRKFPDTRRSVAEVLQGDWDKLGGDMRRATERVAVRGAR
jgi:hypothetical protein